MNDFESESLPLNLSSYSIPSWTSGEIRSACRVRFGLFSSIWDEHERTILNYESDIQSPHFPFSVWKGTIARSVNYLFMVETDGTMLSSHIWSLIRCSRISHANIVGLLCLYSVIVFTTKIIFWIQNEFRENKRSMWMFFKRTFWGCYFWFWTSDYSRIDRACLFISNNKLIWFF